MRKLYVLLAWLFIGLAGNKTFAQTGTTDVANFTFAVNAATGNVVFTNTSTLNTSVPGIRRAYWHFGDGSFAATPPLAGTEHLYQTGGTYTVCLKIYRYSTPNMNDSVLSAQICKTVVIQVGCSANFETLSTASSPLGKYFVAQPSHSQNKKPVRICWTFGDGTDTCIQYPANYTGNYGVYHLYAQPGNYAVCVNILYDGGCEANSCRTITLTQPDACTANFERVTTGTTPNSLNSYFVAIPSHNNNKKPVRICWNFGDGSDTCIQYPANYNGNYGVNHLYTQPGNYNVCVNIHYEGGCQAEKCRSIQISQPDACTANFETVSTAATPLGKYFVAQPSHNNNKKPVRICWTFGDGTDTCIQYPANYTGNYGVYHLYAQPGTYAVCVNILYEGGCQAQKCQTITIAQPDACTANFERVTTGTTPNSLNSYFVAIPSHNNNKKPVRICWNFGDGRDTCIQYPANYNGNYAVNHIYTQPGNYNVCVTILYAGGCEAQKCRVIEITEPDNCRANFERIAITTNTNPYNATFKALPWHNNDKKPVRICWTFGDGRDTCIQYANTFTGPYTVNHTYVNAGTYDVCVNILYQGGCEARKCEPVVIGRPDSCRANFERLPVSSTNNPLTVIYKALPWHSNNKKPARICWTFGDGTDTCINYLNIYSGLYTVPHTYAHPGEYEVCVTIKYYGGCEARKCDDIRVGRPDTCQADFERIPVISTNNPLHSYFKALPGHNNNRKPSKVCWNFGDGRDTCINYPENYTGQYAVSHLYAQPGQYEVCVKILYFGGCEARKCRVIEITRPDSCGADFERLPATAGTTPLTIGFKALPSHNNDKKPVRICWTFGDGRDTCIQYSNTFTGPYTVNHTYTAAGTYEVCVKILYQGGCEARKCKAVVVPPLQATCSVNIFEVSPSITSLIRGFLAVPHSEPVRRPERICWNFGDGTDTCIIIDPSQPLPDLFIRHTYPAPGVYRACVRIKFEGGCIAESCREVVIRPSSNVCGGYMTDSLSGPRTFKFKGYSIHNPNDEVLSYRWTFGDGTSALGREVTHTYNQAGNFEVCLTIKTRLGCETKICKTVRVPGNNQPALHLTPNPVVNVMQVAFLSTQTEPVNIKILNSFGLVVRTYTRNVTVGPNNWSIDLSTLMTGVYSFVIQSPNQLASAIFIKL